MKKVTKEDIRLFNDIYYECKSYAEVSRRTGWSAATIKNYIDHNYHPLLEDNIIRFNPDVDMPKAFDTSKFMGIDNFGELCVLSEEEKTEIKKLTEFEVLV